MPREDLAKLMEFINLFVEQRHRSKEEQILFPLLEKKGILITGGPVGIMLMEHNRARILIKEMNAVTGNGLSLESAKQWTLAALNYSDLMHDHFYKEAEMLFKMADRVPTLEEHTSVADAFKRLEDEKIGPAKHAWLRAMIN